MQIIEFKFQSKFENLIRLHSREPVALNYNNGGNDPIVIRYCVFAWEPERSVIRYLSIARVDGGFQRLTEGKNREC